MSGNKPTTIKEIARKLKISPSTVSRALNDHPSIGDVTKDRVRKIAEEMAYEPNQTAIFFKQRKTFTIGVILPKLSEPFFSDAISTIETVAEEKKYTVLLGQSLDNEQRELNIVQSFKKHRVDGILMSLGKNTANMDYLDILAKTEIPIVFFDCVPDLPNVHKVYSDLSTGMMEAIDAFIDRGHHKIALINGPESLLASKQRSEYFIKALKQRGLAVDTNYIVHTDLTEQGNEDAMESLCALADRPSAVVSFNDFVTLDLIRYAKQRGIVMNQDMYFISYANYPLWKYMDNPPMGSIEQYPDQQAQRAAEILFDCIDKKEAVEQAQEVIFPSKLVLK
ncbi:LacI family DNA-binding transcriptional regulator [Sphingobacterium humi]|uniref:Substrate-binding domain-containing protein n=1 Tax=Sphingobacterium humi TaxID=1796905 RepID=A0A6N8KYC6_9SPHI|nr:LacI family DNA-binding transcriptional regulator [Sphingobacterium humi]MVZ62445.1 substrate-binding domain-containing protein [Sphingobacterium humi]